MVYCIFVIMHLLFVCDISILLIFGRKELERQKQEEERRIEEARYDEFIKN